MRHMLEKQVWSFETGELTFDVLCPVVLPQPELEL